MSDTKLFRAVMRDSSGDVVDGIEWVQLRHLPPFTTLLVRTMNSLYRVVITAGPQFDVQGGTHFPDPTSVYMDGARTGRSRLRVGWIGVGLPVQFRWGHRCIVTSPVLAVTTEQRSCQVVH